MICVTINQTIAQILIAEADALLFHHGETDHKPIPLPTGRISHNAAAANASASTAGDPKRHLKRWERVFLFYKEHISISGNPRCRWESQASHLHYAGRLLRLSSHPWFRFELAEQCDELPAGAL